MNWLRTGNYFPIVPNDRNILERTVDVGQLSHTSAPHDGPNRPLHAVWPRAGAGRPKIGRGSCDANDTEQHPTHSRLLRKMARFGGAALKPKCICWQNARGSKASGAAQRVAECCGTNVYPDSTEGR